MSTVGVVGGGIVGLAVAREVILRRPGTRVVVLEKEGRLGAHQTGHNSGVVHAGIYYRPGSLKATLCARGRDLLKEYCAERGLPYEECGKLVVAVDEAERGRFDALEKTALENAVPGLRRLDGADIAGIEPYTSGLVALHSPRTAITDYVAVARSLGDDIVAAGGEVRLGAPVSDVVRAGGRIEVRHGSSDGGSVVAVDQLIVCAGLHADRFAHLDGEPSPRIIPFRGEYMTVVPAKQDLVRGMVYPVPDPRYPFLGVHFTRRVTGELEVGPNAVLALRREGYRGTLPSARDMRDILTWPGAWRMGAKHWRTGIREMAGSVSRRVYMRAAQRYVPAIGVVDVVRGRAGVRAQAVELDGSLLDDFRINTSGGVTVVRNAPSPAATSSLAIAEHVVERAFGRP
jgi:(S)-2-hydroxyglutarate dehydrogenase